MERLSTWENLGTAIKPKSDIISALKQTGLDYNVDFEPVFIDPEDNGNLTSIPNRFATVRDDGHIYDIVSDKFKIVQNRDAFSFVDYISNDLILNKAGETASGMVYIIGQLPDMDILGDKFTPHLIFRNGFTGKVKISAAICPLRVVCQNQFNFAFKDTSNSITIRHVGDIDSKLEDARNVMKLTSDYMVRLNETAEQYAGVHMTKAEFERVVELMFPSKPDMNPFAKKRLEDQKTRFVDAYNADDNSNFRGNAWGIINAYTDFITHNPPMGNTETKEENKFIVTAFNPAFMNKILTMIQSVKGVAA